LIDVLIVGGGPVGLYLASLLVSHGLTVRVLEQRVSRSPFSRAIGIHPPALEALDRIGVASRLVAAGVQIQHGVAIGNGRPVAGMSFDGLSGRFPFVLSLPQEQTEAILEDRLRELDPAALQRGSTVTGMHDDGRTVTLNVASASGSSRHTSLLAIAADGVRSSMREFLGIRSRVKIYPDAYLMGDFQDSTDFGSDAVLFLAGKGIVESFPLPGFLRRWVVRTPGLPPQAEPAMLAGLVYERTGIPIDPETNSMLSSFGVRSRRAVRLIHGRTALIGDAAHEVSPIGGQGMNLGWLDAAALAPIIVAAKRGQAVASELRAYERSRLHASAKAMHQAGINMALGRPVPPLLLAARNRLLGNVAGIPAVNAWVARRFTMH
jgi:2-polyprenyl-6-methoxyphenol hydroxylase-like FAD-dependent oxidoreductase